MISQFPDEHTETRAAKEMARLVSQLTRLLDVFTCIVTVYVHRAEYHIYPIHKSLYLLSPLDAPSTVVAERAANGFDRIPVIRHE